MNNKAKMPTWRGTLREWRDEMGISQKEAATLLDCGERRIQGIENGDSKYRLSRPDSVFMAVALALKVRSERADALKMIENI